MRWIVTSAAFLFVVWASVEKRADAQRLPPRPTPSKAVPADKCLIKLEVPETAAVSVDRKEYGRNRAILLAMPKTQLPHIVQVEVRFKSGAVVSEAIECAGGSVVQLVVGEPPLRLTLHQGPRSNIHSVAFSPDGKLSWIFCHAGGRIYHVLASCINESPVGVLRVRRVHQPRRN